jgi:hypothetical protein
MLVKQPQLPHLSLHLWGSVTFPVPSMITLHATTTQQESYAGCTRVYEKMVVMDCRRIAAVHYRKTELVQKATSATR